LAPTASVWLPLTAIAPMDGPSVLGRKRLDDVSTDRDLEDRPTLDTSAGEPWRRRSAQGSVAEPVGATPSAGATAPARSDVAVAPGLRTHCAVCGRAGVVVSAWPARWARSGARRGPLHRGAARARAGPRPAHRGTGPIR